MEKKKSNTKKVNRNTKEKKVSLSKNYPKFIGEFLEFYKENLRKKHIIVYVISLVIFFVFLAMFISTIDVKTPLETVIENTQKADTNVFSTIIKQTIPSVFLVIFAGITPFIYLPVIGFCYPYILASDIAESFLMTTHTSNIICMTLGGIIQIFAISLAMVAGFYYCGFSTKRFRYSQRSSFGIYNVKRQLYEIKKDDKKITKLDEEKRKKDEKIEALNVSVPYKKLFYTFIVSVIIAIIGTLIAAI